MKLIELKIACLQYCLKADSFSMTMEDGVKTENLVLLQRNEEGEEVISDKNNQPGVPNFALRTSLMNYLMDAKEYDFLYVHPEIEAFKKAHCKVVTTLNGNNIYKEFFNIFSFGIEKYPLFLLTNQFAYYTSPSRLDEETALSYLQPDTPIDRIDDITVFNVKTGTMAANGDFGIVSLYNTLEEVQAGGQKIIQHGYEEEEDWKTFLQTNHI